MSDKKRIAKNSIVLYLRMLLIMPVTLYTSRIVLLNLGIEDFGIFSIVGGIAVIFSFFNNALTLSSQRFITVSLSKDTLADNRRIFSMCMNCHFVIGCLILILAETLGLWFLNHKINIPPSSIYAANRVYQFALLACILDVFGTPFTGSIIAHEKMSFYAFTSILNAVLKLAIAYAIGWSPSARLELYAMLLACMSMLIFVLNILYCHFNFRLCRYVKSFSRSLFKEIMSFTGWNLFKMGSIIGVSQGNNIIVNLFGGPVASAAIGISNQVNGTVYNFMMNIQTAFNPQITKNIACRNYEETHKLMLLCSKFSFLFLCLIGVPLILQMDSILNIWLKEVPNGTAVLCILSIASVGLDALTGPFNTAIFAKGNIRKYQIVTSLAFALSIPGAWIMLKSGISFQFILVAKIIAQSIILFYSLTYLKTDISLSIRSFIVNQIGMPMIILMCVFAGGYAIKDMMADSSQMMCVILTTAFSTIALLTLFYSFSLSRQQRLFIKNILHPDTATK